jgi:basic membrane protein A
MNNKWRSIISLFISVIVGMGLLTGCSAKGEGEAKGKKIAIVCNSAGQNDNGYNQSAVQGAKKVKEELGYEYKIVEPTNGVPAALEALAGEGYDIIFNLEYDFDALVKGVGGAKPIAEMYPNTTFVCFNDNPNANEDGTPIHQNVISVLFDVHEASYIAGALSVQTLENAEVLFGTDKYKFTSLEDGGRAVGFIGGTNSNGITVFSNGFIEGINKAAEDAGVMYDIYSKYDAGFEDPALGSSVSGTYFNQGANIVFAVAGNVGDGVTTKAKEVEKLAIQVDADKDAQQPGYVLTSVLKNTEVPVFDITKALEEDKLKDMEKLQTFSLASGATGITDLTEIEKSIQDTDEAKAKWSEIKDYIKGLENEIGNGTIKVTNASLGEKFDASVYKNVTMK